MSYQKRGINKKMFIPLSILIIIIIIIKGISSQEELIILLKEWGPIWIGFIITGILFNIFIKRLDEEETEEQNKVTRIKK